MEHCATLLGKACSSNSHEIKHLKHRAEVLPLKMKPREKVWRVTSLTGLLPEELTRLVPNVMSPRFQCRRQLNHGWWRWAVVLINMYSLAMLHTAKSTPSDFSSMHYLQPDMPKMLRTSSGIRAVRRKSSIPSWLRCAGEAQHWQRGELEDQAQ